MKHIKYMPSISVRNFNPIDDNHKELSLSKKIDFKIKGETLDTWISLNTYPNGMKFLTYVIFYYL